jgi:hypothetical protein
MGGELCLGPFPLSAKDPHSSFESRHRIPPTPVGEKFGANLGPKLGPFRPQAVVFGKDNRLNRPFGRAVGIVLMSRIETT